MEQYKDIVRKEKDVSGEREEYSEKEKERDIKT